MNPYSDKNKQQMGALIRRLTRVPQTILYDSLEAAFIGAVNETYQDSGNAAWHWTITGLRQNERNDPRMPFSVKYNHGPIGGQNTDGANAGQVVQDTIAAGRAVLNHLVYVKNRKGAVIYHGLTKSDYLVRAKITESSLQLSNRALEGARMGAAKAAFKANNNY